MSVIGFRVLGHDNGTMMFDDDSVLPKCPRCRFRLDFTAHNPAYRQGRKRRSDLLYTYDGAVIVTRAFRDFCLTPGYSNAHCLPFDNDPEHFHLVVNEPIVPFDAARRKTRFLEFCPVCRNYNEVIGADPIYLLVEKPLADGFYCSDLRFGSGSGKSAMILIGLETKDKMLRAGLRGILFEEANGLENA